MWPINGIVYLICQLVWEHLLYFSLMQKILWEEYLTTCSWTTNWREEMREKTYLVHHWIFLSRLSTRIRSRLSAVEIAGGYVQAFSLSHWTESLNRGLLVFLLFPISLGVVEHCKSKSRCSNWWGYHPINGLAVPGCFYLKKTQIKGDSTPSAWAPCRMWRSPDFNKAIWASSSSTSMTFTWAFTACDLATSFAANIPVTNAFSCESPRAPWEPGPCWSQSPAMNALAKLVFVVGICWWDPGANKVTALLNRRTLASTIFAVLNLESHFVKYFFITCTIGIWTH